MSFKCLFFFFFFLTLGHVAKVPPGFTRVAEQVIELLAFTRRGRELVLRKKCVSLSAVHLHYCYM